MRHLQLPGAGILPSTTVFVPSFQHRRLQAIAQGFGWSSALHREMAHRCELGTWFQGAALACIWVLVGRELRSMRAVVRVGDIALAGARCSASLTLDLTRLQAMGAVANAVCKAPYAIIGSLQHKVHQSGCGLLERKRSVPQQGHGCVPCPHSVSGLTPMQESWRPYMESILAAKGRLSY